MIISFCKYQGAGNDFVLIDNRSGVFSALTEEHIAFLCHRHFGIGADGLMLLDQPAGNDDFAMRYYNSDGRESVMCGNGGRCLTAFAHRVLPAKKIYTFHAADGLHTAEILSGNGNNYMVRLKMIDVKKAEQRGNDYLLDTGAPHFVRFVEDVNIIDFVPEARILRYDATLTGKEGANINFVQLTPQGLRIRTYERGIEDETLACGTGSVAAAIAVQYRQAALAGGQHCHIPLQTRGGQLQVDFTYHSPVITDVFLTGPACLVFEGSILMDNFQ
ncbi:MAG: diaminopimelate epimerase [Prevotellaceae bacterium]|nr:diaminopimelate epimerase [Prevotellaceae bacterium]